MTDSGYSEDPEVPDCCAGGGQTEHVNKAHHEEDRYVLKIIQMVPEK